MRSVWFGSAGVGVAVAGLVVLVVLLRRQVTASPLRGLDRGTRKAVLRALRAGEAGSPEIDELARAVATGTSRQRWVPWAFAVLAALQVVTLVIRIVDRDGRAWLSAVFLGYFILLWVLHIRRQRGLDRFRAPTAGSSSGSHPSS
ncbi:hypothetical protein AB0J80_34805 [Actinoplanes sp. NPDC049548]|uniref:hypothetical protein n=1 Tax=Actinoplanes sp. NPDC049548 TaxID=3155152 RepID=UPI00342F524E